MTHTTRHVLEDIGLERHIHVHRPDNVAELAALEGENTGKKRRVSCGLVQRLYE